MKKIHSHWFEKYRPEYIDDYIFQDKTQFKLIGKFILNEEIPHLLFSGVQGSGKTTLAKILIKELNIDYVDVLTINGSDENSVEVIREKIIGFISTFAIGKFKIVLIEEADYLSLNAQAALRNVMETHEQNARFIMTCNHVHKVMPALISRVQHFKFSSFGDDKIYDYMKSILDAENISFEKDVLDEYIAVYQPDIRKIINEIEKSSFEGKLLNLTVKTDGDYKFKLLELMKTDDWIRIRKLLCDNVSSNEWEDVYEFLYKNLDKCDKFKNEAVYNKGITIVADALYKHSLVAIPEINAAATFIRLSELK